MQHKYRLSLALNNAHNFHAVNNNLISLKIFEHHLSPGKRDLARQHCPTILVRLRTNSGALHGSRFFLITQDFPFDDPHSRYHMLPEHRLYKDTLKRADRAV
jgi:hypothetical protein